MLSAIALMIGAYSVTAYASTDVNSTAITSDSFLIDDEAQNFQVPLTSDIMNHNFIGLNREIRCFGGPRRGLMMDGMRNIEVSLEFSANVNAVLENDSDIVNLVSQGYNVTAMSPIIRTVIQGDGTLSTQASSATVILQGTSGFAAVDVDIINSKVTQIITITRTVIDKSAS